MYAPARVWAMVWYCELINYSTKIWDYVVVVHHLFAVVVAAVAVDDDAVAVTVAIVPIYLVHPVMKVFGYVARTGYYLHLPSKLS